MKDPSSPTRDQTHAPCSGIVESQPLEQPGKSPVIFLNMVYGVLEKALDLGLWEVRSSPHNIVGYLPTVYTTMGQLLSGFCQHGLISNKSILNILLLHPQRDMNSEIILQPS